MSFNFDKDYLEDLEPLLAELERTGHTQAVAQIQECKASGSTGGEILSCINHSLRQALQRETPPSLRRLIQTYLRKAPGY